jgi:hypothetical protein
MNDPIYTFVKGEGWVPRAELIGITRDGIRFRVLDRLPKSGDFNKALPLKSKLATAMKAERTYVLEYMRTRSFDEFFHRRSSNHTSPDIYLYITVEMLK